MSRPSVDDFFASTGRPIARSSLKDQAMAVIRRALVVGEIEPGDIFSASALAQRLGVSNSPVRDACMELVHRGLMEVVPNRGFRVVVFSETDLAEVYELRAMLEVPAMGRLAVIGLCGQEVELLESIAACEQAAERGQPQEFLDHDRHFHLALLALLGNQRLVTAVDGLRDQTRLTGMRRLAERGLLRRSAAEHRRLLDAIKGGDVEAARSAMVAHMAHGSPSSTTESEARF